MPKTSAAKAAPQKEGTSKFAQFIKTNKIDTRRLPYFSRQIEGLTPACLELKAKKAAMKAGKLEKDEAILKSKPHSGRPITGAAINKALFGRTCPVPPKPVWFAPSTPLANTRSRPKSASAICSRRDSLDANSVGSKKRRGLPVPLFVFG